MNIAQLKQNLDNNPKLKKCLYRFIMHPVKTRPNWWIRLFMFTYIKRGKKSIIYKSVRKDIPPFNHFEIGDYSVIEDYSCINNAVGDLIIGSHCRIGLHNTIIGPVIIGNHVHIAQNVVISGLNHNYQDTDLFISEQGVSTKKIVIDDDVWIGANSTILAGSMIGKHCVIASGSVVNGTIPSYCFCAGVPARIIKKYDFDKKEWISCK